METILTNLIGKVRKESRGGRDYLVAPLSLIVPGVLTGSQGSLYYPHEETSKNPSTWNGMPLIVYHPTKNGQNVSGRDPDILEKSEVGRAFRTYADENSVLRSEGWFDIENTKRIDKRVLESLEKGEPIELSTGLFTRNEPSKGSHNGKNYDYIARDYVPDHIAILPDMRGACSIKDGCGVLINKTHLRPLLRVHNTVNYEKSYADKQADLTSQLREKYQKTGSSCASCRDSDAPVGHDGPYIIDLYDDHIIYVYGSKYYRMSYKEEDGKCLLTGSPIEVKRVTAYEPAYNGAEPYVVDETEATTNELMEELKDLIGVNVAPQVRSKVTGYFKNKGAGTGKGDAHEAAQGGFLMVTEEDQRLGAMAQAEFDATGDNPASWVLDHDKWEKAKVAATKSKCTELYACTTAIYKKMGGRIKATENEDTNNAFCPTGPGGGSDPTCSPKGGGGAAAEPRLKDIKEGDYITGKKVKFHEGEHKGYTVTLESVIPMRYRKSEITYRGQIEGIKGGAGQVTVTHGVVSKFAKLIDDKPPTDYVNPAPAPARTPAPKKAFNPLSHEHHQKVQDLLGNPLGALEKMAASLGLPADAYQQHVPFGRSEKLEPAAKFEPVKKKALATAIAKHRHEKSTNNNLTLEEDMKLSANDRKVKEQIVLNCACLNGKFSEKTLNGMSDDELVALAEYVEKKDKESEFLANVNKPIQVSEPGTYAFNTEGVLVRNQEEEEEELYTKDGKRVTGRKVSGGTTKNARPMTPDQWLDQTDAPPEVREWVENARRADQKMKDNAIARLVANLDGQRRQYMITQLQGKSLKDLNDMLLIAPPVNNQTINGYTAPMGSTNPNYLAAGGGGSPMQHMTDDDSDDILPTQVWNWEEMAQEHRKKTKAS